MANLVETIESLQEEIAELTKANENLKILVDNLKVERDEALDSCTEKDNLIASLREDIGTLEDDIIDLETENAELQENSDILNRLRASGVHNWEGYDIALEGFGDDDDDDQESGDWCSEEVAHAQELRNIETLDPALAEADKDKERYSKAFNSGEGYI